MVVRMAIQSDKEAIVRILIRTLRFAAKLLEDFVNGKPV